MRSHDEQDLCKPGAKANHQPGVWDPCGSACGFQLGAEAVRLFAHVMTLAVMSMSERGDRRCSQAHALTRPDRCGNARRFASDLLFSSCGAAGRLQPRSGFRAVSKASTVKGLAIRNFAPACAACARMSAVPSEVTKPKGTVMPLSLNVSRS